MEKEDGMSVPLIDVSGRGRFYINLAHVRRVKVQEEGAGDKVEITFTYSNGDEDTFAVSSERYAELDDVLRGFEIVT